MHKKIEKILQGTILFWAIYALGEGCLYFFNIRLTSIKTQWPLSSIVYASFVERFLGSLFLFVSALCFASFRDLEKYRLLINISGYWAILHAGVLISSYFLTDYAKAFGSLSSLYLWFPLYNSYLLLEGIALITYSLIVFAWSRTRKD